MASLDTKIYVSYHEDAAGGAILNSLKRKGFKNLLTPSKKELDLKNAASVEEFFAKEKPEQVFLSAGKSGSITSNIKYPADYIEENLKIELNVMDSAKRNGTKKLLFFGASCMYPLNAPQPVVEDTYLTGAIESTSESYGVAKIAGVELSRAISKQYGLNFFTVVPATIYGPGSVFDLENSHALTALIKKFCDARANNEKEVVALGTGTPLREFIYVDDLAEACVFLMENSTHGGEIFNVGSGEEISIRDIALKIKDIVGFNGELRFDTSRPDGAMRKFLDSTKLRSLRWRPATDLDHGIKITAEYYTSTYLRDKTKK